MTAPDSHALRNAVIAAVAILAAVLITGLRLAFKPYYIPSAAMVPTLLIGDRLIVDRVAYRSVSGAPALPERGDIVTVRTSANGPIYIKRVVGLPGDRIAMHDGVLVIDGKPVGHLRDKPAEIAIDAAMPCDDLLAQFRVRRADHPVCALPQVRETLPNGVSYDTIDLGKFEFDDVAEITVPPNRLYLLGDNRDESADSRVPIEELGLGGPVPVGNLDGRAEEVTFSMDGSYGLRPSRSGLSLRAGHDR